MIDTTLEKAFFVDMLANGVPVKDDIDIAVLFEEVIDASFNIIDADIITEGDSLFVIDKFGQKVTRASIDHSSTGQRILFYSSDASTALENAEIIGQILMILVTTCVQHDWLNIEPPEKKPVKNVSLPSKETFEFDSEFI